MANPWYKTGTVSVTNNSKNVAGVGTLFVINSIAAGDIFFAPDGNAYEVESVQSDTLIVLTKEYAGSTATNQSYGIVRFIAQSPISLANLIVDKTVKWETLIDQHALYLSGDATSTVTAPENICVNYSLGEVKTDIAEVDCPTGFTYVVSGANLNAGWFLFNDTVGNYRVAKHPETFKAEIEAIKDTAVSAKDSVVASTNLIDELDIRTFEPTVKPTLKLDFARNEAIIYDGAEQSFISKSVTQAVTDGDLTVSNGAANVYDAIGRLAPVSANKARLTFNPETGESEGLLVEEARTNLLTNSSQLSNWQEVDAGEITPNAGESIDGTNTSNKFSVINDSLTLITSNTFSVVNGQTYCCSVIVEAGDIDYLGITFRSFNSIGWQTGAIQFNENPLLDTSIGGSWEFGGVTKLSNGKYHVWAKTTANQDSSAASIDLRIDNEFGNAVQTGQHIYIDAVWLEQGSFPTSPIPEASSFTSRASTGTYYDSTGTLQTAAIDVARYTYNPADLTAPPVLMDEVATTNLLANRTTMATETVTVTSGETYTLSFDGDGSVQLSGADSANVIGTGSYPNEARHTFTATSTSLTLTITGSCTLGQLENLPYRTSLVDGSRSADVVSYAQSTRVADNVYRDLSGYELNGSEGTLYAEYRYSSDIQSGSVNTAIRLSVDGNSANSIRLWNWSGANGVHFYINQNGTELINPAFTDLEETEFNKACISWKGDTVICTVNGIARTFTLSEPVSMQFNNLLFNGDEAVYHKDFKLYSKALSEAECIALTGGA